MIKIPLSPTPLIRLGIVLCSVLIVMNATAQVPKELLKKMASDQFSTREKGYEEAKKWSIKNLKTSPEILHKVWQGSVDPEVKTRCYNLMKEAVIQRQFGRGRGFVGVRMDGVILPGKPGKGAVAGVRITQVVPNTPGQKAGLLAGDVVIGVDEFDFKKLPKALGQNAGVVDAFSNYIQSKHPGDVITLHIMRAGKKIEKKITLMLRPADADMDPFGGRGGDSQLRSENYFNDWLQKMGR